MSHPSQFPLKELPEGRAITIPKQMYRSNYYYTLKCTIFKGPEACYIYIFIKFDAIFPKTEALA